MRATIRLWTWTRWAPLLALTAILAACGAAVASDPATTEPATTPAPTDRQATCADSAIRLPGLGRRGIHGAIVSDVLHMGGATAPATCTEPANQSLLAGLPPIPAGRTEQAQQAQSRYYLIVINYPGGNRLYVVSRRPDGTSCVVDTNDQCIAQVTDLPDDFDLQDLPEDVRPTIPAGRPAPPTVSPPPGDETPPAVEPPPNGYTPPAVSPPPAAGTAPDAAGTPQPSNGATGVAVGGPLLSWAYAPRALSYDVYWGTTKDLAADTERGTPINTSSTFVTIAATASLAHETLYYWRVDAKNEAGTTQGPVWSFTTAAAPAPAPPDKTSPLTPPSDPHPPDGATGGVTHHGPTVRWAPVPGAVSYQVDHYHISSDRRYPGREFPKTSSTFMVLPVFSRRVESTAYWWVTAYDKTGSSVTSKVWSFTIEALHRNSPRIAYGEQPANGATGVTFETLELSWTSYSGIPIKEASSYDVYWSTTYADLGTPTAISTAGISTAMTIRRLEPGTTYYWRVDTKNGYGTTTSNVWSFTTADRAAPAPAAPAEE